MLQRDRIVNERLGFTIIILLNILQIFLKIIFFLLCILIIWIIFWNEYIFVSNRETLKTF